MPLNTDYKPITARIFDGLDQTIRGPSGRHQFPSQLFNRLVVMAVYRRCLSLGQLPETTVFQQAHAVRVPITRRTLFVLKGVGMLTYDVLN